MQKKITATKNTVVVEITGELSQRKAEIARLKKISGSYGRIIGSLDMEEVSILTVYTPNANVLKIILQN